MSIVEWLNKRYLVIKKYESLINRCWVVQYPLPLSRHAQLEGLSLDRMPKPTTRKLNLFISFLPTRLLVKKRESNFNLVHTADILGEYFVLNISVLCCRAWGRGRSRRKIWFKSLAVSAGANQWTVRGWRYTINATLQRPDYDDLEFDRFNAARDFLLKPQWIEQANAAVANELAILCWMGSRRVLCAKLQAEQARCIMSKKCVRWSMVFRGTWLFSDRCWRG